MDPSLFHNEEAELGVLGCMMLAPNRVINIVADAGVEPEWFYSPLCSETFRMILEMSKRHLTVDLTTVADFARSWPALKEQYRDVNTMLMGCIDKSPTAHFINSYVILLQNKYRKRMIYTVLLEHHDMLQEEYDPEEVLASLLHKASAVIPMEATLKTDEKMVKDILEKFRKAKTNGVINLQWPWYGLNKYTSGRRRGRSTVIAARPSVGKTTMMCGAALHDAEQNQTVGIVPLEMDTEEVVEIMAANRAGLNLFDLSSGRGTERDYMNFRRAYKHIQSLDIHINDKAKTCPQIIHWIKRMKEEYDMDSCYIDYIQIMNATPEERKGKSKREHISKWSGELLTCAKETKVQLTILAQIQRAAEAPQGVRKADLHRFTPKLHHLKESGSLEEDAYCVILLYDDPAGEDIRGATPMIAEVAKNRGGPKGTARLYHHKPTRRIVDEVVAG